MMYIRPPVADLRSGPDPKAERVSQLLCFAPCEPLEEEGEFVRVRGPDGYEGWVRRTHLAEGAPPEPNFKVSRPLTPVVDPATGETVFLLPLDVRFRGEWAHGGVKLVLPTGGTGIVSAGAVRPLTWRGTRGDLIASGLSLRGCPYLWGGASPFGFDCSGLVQRLFHFVFDIWLPRDSRDQAKVGEEVELEEAEPCDLLFFPGHVALWVGGGKILHASAREGMVVVSSLSEVEEKFLSIRRVVSSTGCRNGGRG